MKPIMYQHHRNYINHKQPIRRWILRKNSWAPPTPPPLPSPPPENILRSSSLLLLLLINIRTASTFGIVGGGTRVGSLLSSAAAVVGVGSQLGHASSSSSLSSASGLLGDKHGPEFLVEPPNSVIFLNDTGSIVTCSAKGSPTPTIVWTRADGQTLSTVPGLRQIRKDLLTTQLVYLPFTAQQYRQDVHSGVIRCVASNSAGAIQSHDVHVRASVRQPYEIQVYDDFVIKGNTGILRCHIPSFVREYVHVTNWLRYDVEQPITSNLLKGGRYSVMPNGELHVHQIHDDDNDDDDGYPEDFVPDNNQKILQGSGSGPGSGLSVSTVDLDRRHPYLAMLAQQQQQQQQMKSSLSGNGYKRGVSSSSSSGAATMKSRKNRKQKLMFRCQTKHLLSGKTKLSANYGRLIVTEPQSRMPPKILATIRQIVATVGQTIEFPCIAQAHPWPTFQWFRAPPSMDYVGGHHHHYATPHDREHEQAPKNSNIPQQSQQSQRLQRLLVSRFQINSNNGIDQPSSPFGGDDDLDGRLIQVDSSLFIRDVAPSDGGHYVCIANNSMGQDRVEIELLVKAPLSATMIPNRILATDGDTIQFNCSINGTPVQRIQWRRNARPLSASPSLSIAGAGGGRVHLLDQDRMLQIKQVRREDRGMFQCIVGNEFESVQASGELALADDPPSFISVFSIPEPLKPGKSLSVKCSAIGTPLPQIVWTLDGVALADHGRIRVGDYVSTDGVVHSFVNITTLRTEDGGIYSCTASNDVHSISHSGRINVYGPAFVRPMKNVTAISGNNIHLHCPAAGYPLESIVWYKKPSTSNSISSAMSTATTNNNNHHRLPQNHRHKSLLNGTLLIEKVERATDEGAYRCVVTGANRASTASAELFIRVLVAPVISPFHPPPNLREGMRVMLTCSVVEGDSPVLIQFLKDGEPIHESALSSSSSISTSSSSSRRIKLDVTNEFSATLFISSVVAEDSGNYTCIASNMAAVTTYSIMMKVNVPPKWKIPPQDTEAIEGQNVVIDCSASGEPRIWWERAYDKPPSLALSSSSSSSLSSSSSSSASNGAMPISSSAGGTITTNANGHTTMHYFRTVVSNSHMHTLENGSLMIRDVSEEDSGVYLCQANNGVGSGLSKVITLKVHVPAHFKSKFAAQTVQRGDSIEFACDAYGEQPLSILVAKDRMPLDFDTDRAEGEQTLHTDNRYRIQKKFIPEGLTNSRAPNGASTQSGLTSLVVRITNVDRRDSSLFTCLASNAYGKDEYNFQLIVQEPPGRPENVHVLEIESRSAVIAWSQPYSGNSPIVAYHVEWRQWIETLPQWQHLDAQQDQQQQQHLLVNGMESSPAKNSKLGPKMVMDHQQMISGPPGTIFRQTLPATENSIALRSLKPMTSYEIRVQAENKLGLGPFQMPPLKITTKEEAPSGPPLNIRVYPISAHALQVTFQPPRPEHQNGQILGYYIGYKAMDVDEPFMFKKVVQEDKQSSNGGGSPKEVKITDLRRATKYLIIVQALNRIGPGPQSEEVIGETLVNDPPRAPMLTSVNVDYDSVELSWSIETTDSPPQHSAGSAVSGGSGSNVDIPEITGYFLYAKPSGGDWEERQVDAQQTSYTFTNLLCGTQYQFYVIAYNNVGKGDPSQAIAVRTKGSVPIAPKNWNTLITVNSTTALIRLDTWLVNGCEIKYFIIKYRPRMDTEWLVASAQISPKEQRWVELVDLRPASWYLLNMAALTDIGTTEETYMFSTLTVNGETIPPLDTISRTLTSANSIAASSSASGSGGSPNGGQSNGPGNPGYNTMQSLTIVIPATCSVIVLTVIVIVACFVLGTKRSQHFESTLLTAFTGGGGGANGGGGSGIGSNGNGTIGSHHPSQANTPHHHHHHFGPPIDHQSSTTATASSYCQGNNGNIGDLTNEPRYSGTTNITTSTNGNNMGGVLDHYGFCSGGGDLQGKCNGSANIELINAAAVMNYATLKKRATCLQQHMTTPTNNTDMDNNGPNIDNNNNGGGNSKTTCLDSKLCDQQQQQSMMDTPNGGPMTNNDQNTVHYFQTPYALSRLPRCTTTTTNNNHNGGGLDEDHTFNPCLVNGGVGVAMGVVQQQGPTSAATSTTNVGGCTLRQQNNNLRPIGMNGDHVYDMPFPPKWV